MGIPDREAAEIMGRPWGDEAPVLSCKSQSDGSVVKCEKCGQMRNMLEDVVNELDLSGEMIEKHGQLGTAPAELVRLVLEEKDRRIAMLKRGMKERS